MLIKAALSPDTKIPSDGLTSKIISEMAEYEIQYLDVLNKMNLEPDDLERVFKLMLTIRCHRLSVNQKVIIKNRFENRTKHIYRNGSLKH